MNDLALVDPGPEHALTAPDAVLGLRRDGAVVATAALWWRQSVTGPDGAAGRIGHVRWETADDGAALLEGAVERLQREGCALALGPIDGSTWHAYRVVTESDDAQPPFALEPWPPSVVADAFERAGFAPVAHYLSSIVEALPDEAAQLRHDRDRLAPEIAIRPFRVEDADAELRALHGLLLRAFAQNPYYAPLGLDTFLALYRPLVARVDPDLVLVAEAAGQPVGVLLAYPDWAQAARGEAIDTIIVKTLAVDPEWRGRGLGGALVRAGQERAREKGFGRAIHALMHAENDSVKISQHLGRPFRRYALLGRTL